MYVRRRREFGTTNRTKGLRKGPERTEEQFILLDLETYELTGVVLEYCIFCVIHNGWIIILISLCCTWH